MDVVSNCKDKLAYFRIKELKDVLTQLGLAKQGKKQDLMDRILGVISDDQGSRLHGWGKKNFCGKEAVAKIIDDTYRKMRVHGATDLASKSQNGSNSSLKPKEEIDDSLEKIRCPCGNTTQNVTTVKCEDPRCGVWQHLNCVVIPEKPMEGGQPEIPTQFYCEVCRVNRADPFWVTLGSTLLPVKLSPSNIPQEGGNPVQIVEKTFTLNKADRELLQKPEYDLQAWCILLNDKVPFRMQWPQHADLQVNGVPVRTTNRPGSQLLGINGRDDGPLITACSREGINKIFLSAGDTRVFCLGVRIVRRRTVQQVLSLILKDNGEKFEEALARVCRCIGGGNSDDNADSDSDLEVVAESVTVNLRCPMSGSRMRIPGRFKPCIHMGCFDLETFVELNQRSRKWQCPICLKNYSMEDIIIDPYFKCITNMMRTCGEDVTEIEVRPDGSWRAKNENECRNLTQWHNPDGTPRAPIGVEIKPDAELLRQVKQEGGSDGPTPLKLGIKRNRNGFWEVSKPEDVRPLSSGEKFETPKVVPMSSSATGSYRDGEDPSVNQDGGGQFDFSMNNGHELDSVPLNYDSTYGATNRVHSALQPPSLNQNVIVLSDSEEDNVHLVSPEAVYEAGGPEANGISFPVPPQGVSDTYHEDPGLSTSGNPGLGLFNNGADDFGALWSLPHCPQTGPGFQLFATDTDVQDTLVEDRHTSAALMNDDYGLCTDQALGSGSQVLNSSGCRSSTEMSGGLVDNPLAFCGEDPSLQIFLPTVPTSGVSQPDLRDGANMSTTGRTEDWISLRLGGCDSVPPANGFNSRHDFASKDGRMDTLADTASLLLSMNEDRSDKSGPQSRQSSGGPFSHPRQPRSVRPRLYLSIDSDSD
ncbi:E3 SUMO-protein ligase SIZ1-like [Aristolochia californica]|uniref:E3 SUMO-protein ligase SIZ1-like n=1 Tax=Aristolochia californica TaxID=171875 RepID=UPI0035DAB947